MFELHLIYGEGTNSGQWIIQFSPNSLIQTKHIELLRFTYTVTNSKRKEKKKDMSVSVWKLCYTLEKEIAKISLRDVMEHLQQKNLSNFSSETVAQWTWYSRNSGDND